MILRGTGRLLDLIGVGPRDLAAADPSANDWYAHLLWIDRRKCLLFAHAETMLSIFVPDVRKADVQPFATVLVSQIATGLAAEGLPLTTLGLLDPGAVRLAATASRTILGCMRNDASMLEHTVAEHGSLHRCDIAALNHDSGEPFTCHVTGSPSSHSTTCAGSRWIATPERRGTTASASPQREPRRWSPTRAVACASQRGWPPRR